MTALISTFMMLGVMVGGLLAVIHRCDWLNFCDSNSVAATPPTAVGIDEEGDPKATDADNGKTLDCGCCKCTQKSTKSIHCVKDSGDVLDYTTGNSLAKQCKRCNDDPLSCKGASTTQTVNAPDSVVAKKASKAACGSKICQDDPALCKSLNCPAICGSGLKLNSNGVCVSATASKKQSNAKPNAGGDSPGCPSGQTLTNCKTVGNQLQCSCSNFARQSFYAMNPKPPVFRSHLSF